ATPVGLETAREPEDGVEVAVVPEERGGPVAGGVEPLGERRKGGVERVDPAARSLPRVAHAVLGRSEAGQQGRVTRRGPGGGGGRGSRGKAAARGGPRDCGRGARA